MNIYIEFKKINVKHKSGFLKFFDLSGVQQSLNIYIGKHKANLTLYMTTTLLEDKGFKGKRCFKSVMSDGNTYKASTEYTLEKPFYKAQGHYSGNIINNEFEIAKVDFYDRTLLGNWDWQVSMSTKSGNKYNISSYEKPNDSLILQLLYGNRIVTQIKKNDILLMEIKQKYYYPSRQSLIGKIKTDLIKEEIMLLIPLYFYVIYPDYIENHSFPS